LEVKLSLYLAGGKARARPAENKMAAIATYIPYSELNDGEPSTLDQFHAQLSAFARTRILHLCSVMNALLRSDENTINQEAHDALVKAFFEPQLAQRLLMKRSDFRVVFHRQQILFVAKTAVLHCPDDGLIPDSPQFRRLGRIFLMAGDHLPSVGPTPEHDDDKFAFLAAQLLPIQEASGFHRFDHKVARSYRMLSQCGPLLRNDKPYYDIEKSFEELTNVPLLTFQSLLFGSLARFHQFDPEAYRKDPRSYGLRRAWFNSTRIAPLVVERFLELVSATPAEFKSAYQKANQGNSDFTAFRDRPLFRDEDFLFLIDFAFLAEKFETAPFWTVHNSLPDRPAKDGLHAFWGRVFEKYGCDVLRSSAAQPLNVVHESPIFVDKQRGQVCDLIVVCGNSAAFVELKGATFSSLAKYGGDHLRLKGELDSKLVREPAGSAKAVHQLKRAIELACNPDHPEPVDGIDLRNMKTIYPVIVTRDDIGGTVGVNGFLQIRFDEVINRKQIKKIITPLFCMNAEDLERLSAYLKDTSLTDLLYAHYRASRRVGKYLSNPYFATDGNAILKEKGLRRPDVVEGFWHELSIRAAEHLGLRRAP
jgi:hypothetical protein